MIFPIRKRFLQAVVVASAPLAIALQAPQVQAFAVNSGDPVGIGGSPTFNNASAAWSYSVFDLGSSIYPFFPFTQPACTLGPSGTCSNLNFVYDNTRVVWAANASADTTGNALNPITTIDMAATLPNANESYSVGYVDGGDPVDGSWAFGYVFGPADSVTNSYNGAQVNYLGFFNGNGADIVAPHGVNLWEYYTGSDPISNPPVLLASVTIAPGSVGTVCDVYADLFCWVQLSTPVTLQDNQFYTVGAYGGYSPGTSTPVPAPLPWLGATVAFGMSRRLRRRLRRS